MAGNKIQSVNSSACQRFIFAAEEAQPENKQYLIFILSEREIIRDVTDFPLYVYPLTQYAEVHKRVYDLPQLRKLWVQS